MEIRPFRGWRYRAQADGDITPFIAPPYDILLPRDKQVLLDRSERNIVAVDLPHCPAKDVGPDRLYEQAARTLRQWQASGVLIQDDRPCLYAYRQSFVWAGRTYGRRAILCGLRAGRLGQDVIPHEKVFPGPKADRLKLTELTGAQLSPIFGFFHDEDSRVMDLVFSSLGEPDAHGLLHGVREQLWAVSDENLIAEAAARVRATPVFIADGHHRYTTALTYRDNLRAAGLLEKDHEANFVLFALVARSDPGLLVLPTHRIVSGLKDDFTLAQLRARCTEFSWQAQPVRAAQLEDADGFLRPLGPGAMAVVAPGGSQVWIARLKDVSAMAEVAADQLPVWRELDVAILHRLLLDRGLAPWRTEKLDIEYTPDGPAVLAACNSGRAQLGICLQGTPLEAVEAVGLAGGAMPHKSTYFYPKLATGMVLKPLT